MTKRVQERLKQASFVSPHQEAYLGLLVAADKVMRLTEEICEKHGLTAAQYNVLRILRGVYPDGHPRFEIIQRMITVAPDVTRLIDRLETMDLAVRKRSSIDRRHSLTMITEKGLAILKKMQPDVDVISAQFAAVLTEAEAKKLASLCDKITGISE